MISLVVFALCVMGVVQASILDLIHDPKCRATIPDIPADLPKNGNYKPDEFGHFYEYAFFHSNDDLSPADIRCSESDFFEEKPSRIQDGHSYIYNYTYFNITTKQREVTPEDFQNQVIYNDETNTTYVTTDKDGHIKAHPAAGRSIIKKLSNKNNLYFVDYGFDQTFGHCQLWWQLYGPNKIFSDEEFKEALHQIENVHLPIHHYYRIKHDDC